MVARPREFDEENAVANALDVFWTTGFDGSSLDTLERATGLNRSSLYNTFGGKNELFIRALDAYRKGPCEQMLAPLAESGGGQALVDYFTTLSEFVGSSIGGRGCLMVNTTLESNVSEDSEVSDRVDDYFKTLSRLLRKRFQEALSTGEIESPLSPKEAAVYLATFVRGILASAAAGVDAKTLKTSIRALFKQFSLSAGFDRK